MQKKSNTPVTAIAIIILIGFGVDVMGEQPEMAEGLAVCQDIFNTSLGEWVACYRIPALATAPDGTVIAAIDERVPSCADLGKNKDINIVIRRSEDHGETWLPLQTVVDYEPGIAASDPSMIVDRETREVFLFYNYMDHNEAPDIYRLHFIKSADSGLTWTKPEDITSQVTKSEWHADFQFITSGEGIQTRSGVLLHTLVNLANGLHLFGSRDHGATWFLIDHPLVPGDESRVVELADGSWMVNSRVRNAGMRYVHVSPDEGASWTTRPEPALPDPACNASLIRYTSVVEGQKKNRLLFSNANSKDKRENLTVRISYDEGSTWTAGKTIYAGPSAYSTMTILHNGDIGLFFEKDDHQENVFVRFSLEWLTDGEDTLGCSMP